MDTKNVAIGRKALNAIKKLQGTKGISLPELKKYLQNEKKMDIGFINLELKMAIKNYMDRDILSREGGLYKVKETKRRRSRSKGRKSRSRSKKRTGSRKRRGSKRASKSSGKKRSGSRRRRRRKKASPEE